jgi:hypothetical protein
MYIFDYDPFVYEYINTREYIMFSGAFDQSELNSNGKTSCYFFNKMLDGFITLNKINSEYNYSIENFCFQYKQYFGKVDFSGQYKNYNPCVNIQEFIIDSANGMFEGLEKVIIDYREPYAKLYFIGIRQG